mmetsp:Transcript_2078/g.7598  ORF Transcript_2078/g.7598 Transcript_2078/m.7598 type:complete len:116 (-) Transcript_2078:1235-1582(-)
MSAMSGGLRRGTHRRSRGDGRPGACAIDADVVVGAPAARTPSAGASKPSSTATTIDPYARRGREALPVSLLIQGQRRKANYKARNPEGHQQRQQQDRAASKRRRTEGKEEKEPYT